MFNLKRFADSPGVVDDQGDSLVASWRIAGSSSVDSGPCRDHAIPGTTAAATALALLLVLRHANIGPDSVDKYLG